MKNIQIIATGSYLPQGKVDNEKLANELEITKDYIYKRTGIQTRYYSENENIEDMAIRSVENLFKKNKTVDLKEIDLIIVATTSTDMLMPGISYKVQEKFNIENCMCIDILAGCAGYINAFDIARTYITIGKVNQALIIGVDILSKYTNTKDISTSIILSDGAGATIIKGIDLTKQYNSLIESYGQNGDILTNNKNEMIKMDGKQVYKYAVTDTVENINKLLEMSNTDMEKVKYIVPHQSNIKIMNSIACRLKIDKNKIYTNIFQTGNTFCASIPIALCEMYEKKLITKGDKIIMIGYGGGLNTGSILLEI